MENEKRHWRGTKRIVVTMVSLWFLFGVVFPLLMTDWLNQFQIGGFPLGFWMSTQGSIIAFVIILFTYVRLMNRLDRKYKEERDA